MKRFGEKNSGGRFSGINRLFCIGLAFVWSGTVHAQTCELYPIALSAQTLNGVTPGTVLVDIYNGTQPGNFGWLSWTGDQSVPALEESLTPPGNSAAYVNPDNPTDHTVNVGDWVSGLSGVDNSKSVRRALDTLATRDIIVPIWDSARGSGANTAYRVCGFAQVRLLSYRLASQNRITARFLGYVQCDPTNLPPVAYSLSVTSYVNTPVQITLAGFDQEGSPLTYTIVDQPANGALTGTAPNLTYEPAENFTGSDSFTYKVNDGTSDSAPATVNITILPPPQGLVVDAGPDQLIVLPASATLNGTINTVSVPGMPPETNWTVQWSVVSGPGTVTFANPNSAVTTATFSESGIYELRLTGTGYLTSASDDVVIVANAAPVVSAGPNQTNTMPGPVTLLGFAVDDGLPTNDVLSVAWSKVSGPGVVAFSDADDTNTIAYFSAPGMYVLQLTANHGVASASSDVIVVITPPSTPPEPGACQQQGIPVKGYTMLGHPSNYMHDIVFVIDTSASTKRLTGFDLNGDGRVDSVFEAEVESCRRLVRMLTNCPYFRMGLVKFARYNTSNAPVGSISDGPPIPAQTRVVQPITNNTALIEAALDVVAAEGAKGGTHTAAGIDLAIEALTNAPPVNLGTNVTPTRHIVLLTDGIPTLPVESGWTQERGDRLATLEAAERAAAAGIRIHPVVIDPEEYAERKLTTMPAVQALTGVANELIRINVNNINRLPQLVAGLDFAGNQKVVVVDHTSGATWTINVRPDGWFEAVLPVTLGTNVWEFRFPSGDLISDQILTRTVTFVVYPRNAVVDVVGLSASNPPVSELTFLERPTGGPLYDAGPELSLLTVLTNKAPAARVLPGVEGFRTLSGTMTLEFIFKGAGYNSDVGYFLFDPANPPQTAAEVLASVTETNVFLNSGIVPNNNLNVSGLSNTIEVPAGVAVGLFMIPNGTLADAKAGRGNPPLFTLANLNPGQFDQALTFYDPVGNQIICAFEDISITTGKSDQDFQDLVFTVKPVDPMPQPLQCIEP